MMIERDCIIEHEGRKFEAGGAVVTDEYLIAYPDKDGVLKDWHGNVIGTYRVISSRKAVFFGIGDKYFYMRAQVGGREYSIRGFGDGMVAMGKRVKG